jgi:hypothetical protein
MSAPTRHLWTMCSPPVRGARSRSATAGMRSGWAALPAGLIAREVPFGAAIACMTPAEHLITAGSVALGRLRVDRRVGAIPYGVEGDVVGLS